MRDIISSTFILLLSILTCIGATRLQIGSFSAPGSGFFPFALGVVMGCLSFGLLLKTGFEREIVRGKEPFCGFRGIKVLFLLFSLVLYGFFVERIGYTLTTFLLFIFLLRGINPQKWYVVIGGALFASLGSYAMFQLALKVQLPRGFLGM